MACAIAILAVFAALVGIIGVAEGARAFFVFGDSLVDNGNNNYLVTTARADSPPYGIDYPTRRPTGRFSNGYNIPDLISQALGAESTLPYLSPELRGEKLLVGANFASAGIGILNDTGIQFSGVLLGDINVFPSPSVMDHHHIFLLANLKQASRCEETNDGGESDDEDEDDDDEDRDNDDSEDDSSDDDDDDDGDSDDDAGANGDGSDDEDDDDDDEDDDDDDDDDDGDSDEDEDTQPSKKKK